MNIFSKMLLWKLIYSEPLKPLKETHNSFKILLDFVYAELLLDFEGWLENVF